MSLEELQKSDLKSVSEWLNCTISELDVVIKVEPIATFKAQIDEMKSTYEEFPEDKERTDQILCLLQEGAEMANLYVEKDDPSNFVMEGRHRMVAFDLIGQEEVKVAYCSKRR